MTRNPAARRVHSAESAPDDAFVANVLESSVWAKQHARTLLIAVAAVAVLVVATLLFLSSRRSGFERATQELTPLRALVQGGQAQQAIPQLEAYLQKHGAAAPADEARLLLAGQYLATGEAAKAIATLEDVSTDYGEPVAVNAAFARAAAYEAQNEPHRAEEIYLEVGEKAPFQFQKNDALDSAARLRLARNDAAGAAELYQRLLDATPVSQPVHQVWEMRLAEARAAQAASPAAAAK